MPHSPRILRLFLVYALAWPITLGDKMVRLEAPASPEGVSSPWVLYQDLSRSLFGTSDDGSRGEGALRSQDLVEPASLLPFQRQEKKSEAAESASAGRTAPLPRPAAARRSALPIPPPSPVVPFHLNSKK